MAAAISLAPGWRYKPCAHPASATAGARVASSWQANTAEDCRLVEDRRRWYEAIGRIAWREVERRERLLRFGDEALNLTADGHEAVLMPWPSMRAFRRLIAGGDWQAFEPEFFRIATGPVPAFDPDIAAAFEQFASSVPGALRGLVAPFADGHWALLSWLARAGTVGDDLLMSNACLAYLLGRAASFAARPGRAQPAWASRPYRPQKVLLGHLGFPATDAMRRIARKVLPSAVTVPKLASFRTAVVDDPDLLGPLSHLCCINSNVLVAVSAGGSRVTPRW